ncbi:hypothetical protein V494_02202 [Pseudogymnoascus sp. VKM F-4513 (FW-928)]|nr:hypothetical protein V494_02202 [Pseudogymnoascus sp. VKM F-4513 (FW-928)]
MVKVAVAGGSSPTLGHALVAALLSTNGRHTPIILSRQKIPTQASSGQFITTKTPFRLWPSPSSSPPPGQDRTPEVEIETRYVDYTSTATLIAALHDIDTLISVLLIPNPTLFVQTQLNLLDAAQAAGCRRFAPSEFALPYNAHARVEIDAAVKIPVWQEICARASPALDVALFPCGMFMNYLGIGCPLGEGGRNRDSALAGFAEGPFLFHLEEGWVEVPLLRGADASGDDADSMYPLVTATDIRDVGRFVVAAIDLEEPWGGRELGMAGSTMRFDEVVRLCERYIGRPLEVRGVTRQQLEERLCGISADQVEGIIPRMECQLSMVYCDGDGHVDPVLNRLCPWVRPMTMEDFLRKYWSLAREST